MVETPLREPDPSDACVPRISLLRPSDDPLTLCRALCRPVGLLPPEPADVLDRALRALRASLPNERADILPHN